MAEGTDLSAWKDRLSRWSKDLIADPSIAEDLPPDVVASGWLGYPPATEKQIQAAEARLGTALPPSYRAFLKTSNGWRNTTTFVNKLWSTEEVDWFRVRNREWIEAWTETGQEYGSPEVSDEDYFVYGEAQDPVDLRTEYLETALEISDTGDGCIYLLNPRIVTPDGEWEAWFFANWAAGADRYRSFWEMMQAEYRSYLDILEAERERGEVREPRVRIPQDGPRVPTVELFEPDDDRETTPARWIALESVRAWATSVLDRVGVPGSDAAAILEALLDAELRGEAEHGLRTLGPLVEAFVRGELNPAPRDRAIFEDPLWTLIDGDRGSGLVVADRITSRGIERARAEKHAQTYATNVGELVTPSSFALRIAAEGMLAYVATNVPSVSASADPSLPVLQPRTFACAIPLPGDPILFDQQTYLTYRDAVQLLLTAGLPRVFAFPQSQPFEASLTLLAATLNLPKMLPFGGEDLLTHLVWILNPAAFPSAEDFPQRMAAQIERAKTALGARASEVDRLSEVGERAQRRRRQLLAEGKMILTGRTLSVLTALGDNRGNPLPT